MYFISLLVAIFAIFCQFWGLSDGKFVGAFIFPHGAITIDPQTRDFSNITANKAESKEQSIKLNENMVIQAKKILEVKPDLIIISTPHGLALLNGFTLLGNEKASGSVGEQWDHISAEVLIDVPLTYKLYNKLHKKGNAAEILSMGATNEAMSILWAEIVPFWFLKNAATETNFTMPKAIILGQPTNYDFKKIPEMLKAGRDIYGFIKDKTVEDKRIAIVVSGDLSHYHSRDPTSPFPFNENAIIFDNLINDWAKIDVNEKTIEESSKKITKDAGLIANTVGSCGFSGMVLLQGFFQEFVKINPTIEIKANNLYYSAPTYFGMIVSNWIPNWI